MERYQRPWHLQEASALLRGVWWYRFVVADSLLGRSLGSAEFEPDRLREEAPDAAPGEGHPRRGRGGLRVVWRALCFLFHLLVSRPPAGQAFAGRRAGKAFGGVVLYSASRACARAAALAINKNGCRKQITCLANLTNPPAKNYMIRKYTRKQNGFPFGKVWARWGRRQFIPCIEKRALIRNVVAIHQLGDNASSGHSLVAISQRVRGIAQKAQDESIA